MREFETNSSLKLARQDQFERLVDMLSRGWVTPDDAYNSLGALRLATFIEELSNKDTMSLTMERRDRHFEGGRQMRAYHLPVQIPGAFAFAADTLPRHMHKVASALRLLERAHPCPNGLPTDLPGMSLEEAGGAAQVARGKDGKNLQQTVFELLTKPNNWITSAYIQEHYGSTRLAAYVDALRKKGHNVILDNKGRHGAYHLFTDADEEKAFLQARAQTEQLKAAEASKHGGSKAKQLEIAVVPGGSQYGRWMTPQATGPQPGGSAPRSLFAKPNQTVRPASGATQVSVMSGQSGAMGQSIPVSKLDAMYPHAKNNEIVDLDGTGYRRKYRPASKEGNTVTKWEMYWIREQKNDAYIRDKS